MKMILNSYENDIIFENTCVNTIEIINKKAFYNFLLDINNLTEQDNIIFYENDKIKELSDKIHILSDYINIDFSNKKIMNNLLNYINNSIDSKMKDNINEAYQKIYKLYSKILANIDIRTEMQEEFSLQDITKLMKIQISNQRALLENLLLLIDIESELKIDELLVFVNLKQYLNNKELEELYKYSLYKEVKILLIDNTKNISNKYEKKLFIDDDLVEFML